MAIALLRQTPERNLKRILLFEKEWKAGHVPAFFSWKR
ncbi:hypothetical protein LEP1GSC192_1993 [Leptospira sp. B5-022]|nr:hypothetical protein LEP1GSC192_1993 [Leptospira sp. B5-022]